MMRLQREIYSDLNASELAAKAFKQALLEHQIACVVGNWSAAELARQWALGALEAHLDAVTAVYVRARQCELRSSSEDPS